MRAELCAAALLLAAAAGPARAEAALPAADPIGAAMAEAVQRFGLPEVWIRAVIRRESGGDPRATSPKGAMGLMQLMPDTWAALRAQLGLGPDPFDVHDNILAGAGYLRQLYDQFGPYGFLAAYNAGPRRYLDFIDRGRPLPAETRAYVVAVVRALSAPGVVAPPVAGPAIASPVAAPPSIFVRLSEARPASAAAAPGLFVVIAGR